MKILKSDQIKAFERIKMFLQQPTGGMFLLEGSAGTGKTFLTKEIILHVQATSSKRVAVTAPTNRALKVMKRMIGLPEAPGLKYATTHSILALTEFIDGFGKITFKRSDRIAPLVDFQILLVDEVSMLHDDLFNDLLDFISYGMKIIFIGDSFQIPPVNLKSSLPFDKSVRTAHNIQTATLTEIIRQKEGNPIIKLATNIRDRIFSPAVILEYEGDATPLGEVRYCSRGAEMELFSEILPLFNSEEYKNDPDHIKVLAWRNTTVDAYNLMIRNFLFGNTVQKIVEGEKLIMLKPLVEDRQVLLSINDEVEVVKSTVEELQVDTNVFLKYYNTTIKAFGTDSEYDLFNLPIIHEESEAQYKEIVELMKNYALSFKQGTYQAKNAWVQYYEFQKAFPEVSYGYSITCHRSQGGTYHTAIVNLWDSEVNKNVYERNRVLYTACTRPSNNLILIY